MRLHERTLPVQQATAELSLLISKFVYESDLTYVEALQALNEVQASFLKYMLRDERHPDSDKRGDEA